MPELPEVETIRLQLDKVLRGLKITEVEVLTEKSLQGERREIGGRRVMGVKRRAKITIIELEGGIYLTIHLKLTGQLVYREQGIGNKEQSGKYCEQKDGPYAVCDLPNKFTRVILSFDNGAKLYFNDLRIFGWMKIVRDLGNEKFGPEANDKKSFSFEYLKKILSKTKKPIKIVIMDQEKLAGVGNIYANEALFEAGIMPTRKSDTLSDEEIKNLRESIIKILNKAIEQKGSSDRDEAYRQITGEKGQYQNYLQVYGRVKQKCPKCGGIIKRSAIGGRGSFYCENCQK
jgi:formamidopyrimidine-DNA glycosylase